MLIIINMIMIIIMMTIIMSELNMIFRVLLLVIIHALKCTNAVIFQEHNK